MFLEFYSNCVSASCNYFMCCLYCFRSAWRVVSSIAQKDTSSDSDRVKLAKEYSVKIEEELDLVCKEVLVRQECVI